MLLHRMCFIPHELLNWMIELNANNLQICARYCLVRVRFDRRGERTLLAIVGGRDVEEGS